MIENTAFVKSELAYRTDRLRGQLSGRRRAHVRGPWVRRPAQGREKTT